MTDEQRRPEPESPELKDEQHDVEDLAPDAEAAENVKGGGWPYLYTLSGGSPSIM